MRNLKQTLSHGLVFENVHTFIKCNQKAWLESCICMNTETGKKIQKMVS